MIQEKTARRIASKWYYGQWSGLYKFVSTGHVSQDAIDELNSELEVMRRGKRKLNKGDSKEFQNLIDYLRAKLPKE